MESLISLLNILSKYGVQVRADLVNERRQEQRSAQSFRSVHQSVSRRGFVVGGSTVCLDDHVEDRKFIRDRLEFGNKDQRVFACYALVPSGSMWNGFPLIGVDGEDGSMLRVAKVLPLFRLDTTTDGSRTEYVLLTYKKCPSQLDEVDEVLSGVCAAWSTTDEKCHRAAVGKELINRVVLNMGLLWRERAINENRVVVHIVLDNYGNPPLSTTLTWRYHSYYIYTLYRDDSLQLESIKKKNRDAL